MSADEKVWVLSCSEAGCPWNEMVPRAAQPHHRADILARHLAEDHKILPVRLRKAIEEPGVTTIALWPEQRIARIELDRDLDLIVLAGLTEFVTPKRANGVTRIDYANGSRTLHIGGRPGDLERRLRGMQAVHIDGRGLAYEAAHFVLMAGGAK